MHVCTYAWVVKGKTRSGGAALFSPVLHRMTTVDTSFGFALYCVVFFFSLGGKQDKTRQDKTISVASTIQPKRIRTRTTNKERKGEERQENRTHEWMELLPRSRHDVVEEGREMDNFEKRKEKETMMI